MYKPPLNTQPAFDCRATAALLRSLSPLIAASQVGAFAAVFFRDGWVSLACWLGLLYFGVRVKLDAELFDLLARDPESAPRQLDQWLNVKRGRNIEDRCRGGRRLALQLVCACVAQALALAFAISRGRP